MREFPKREHTHENQISYSERACTPIASPSKDSGRIFGTGSFVASSFAASILLTPASLIFAVRSEG